MLFLAENFFNLSSYEHSSLFVKELPVWEALKHIKSYIQSFTLGKIEGDVSDQAFLVNPDQIVIGKGSVVEPGAYIKGPCIIGRDCVIRHGAYIRGDVITGNQCVIGHDTEIKHSILLNKAHAAHFAYLGDSILGNDTNLGAGVKCANLKLDRNEVFIHHKGEKIATTLRKFGAIFGDFCQIGCNSVSNPGTLMGKSSLAYPCTNFGGFIEENSSIKPFQKSTISKLSKAV